MEQNVQKKIKKNILVFPIKLVSSLLSTISCKSAAKLYPTPQSGAGVALAAGSDSGGAYAPVGSTLLLRYQLQIIK